MERRPVPRADSFRVPSQSGFVAAYVLKTEKFFDLLGSLGFFSISVASLVYGDFYYARQVRHVTTSHCKLSVAPRS